MLDYERACRDFGGAGGDQGAVAAVRVGLKAEQAAPAFANLPRQVAQCVLLCVQVGNEAHRVAVPAPIALVLVTNRPGASEGRQMRVSDPAFLRGSPEAVLRKPFFAAEWKLPHIQQRFHAGGLEQRKEAFNVEGFITEGIKCHLPIVPEPESNYIKCPLAAANFSAPFKPLYAPIWKD